MNSGQDPKDIVDEVHRLEAEEHRATPSDAYVERPVVYGSVGDRQLLGTLFLPKNPTRGVRPAVVYIHGGGWEGGTATQFSRHAASMAGKGFVGICIDYRLSGEAPFPAALHDCKCAVRYLRASATSLNIDPKRIGAVGGSAGAHLSAMLATTAGRAEWEGNGGHSEHSSAIQAAVLFNGEFDLPSWWRFGKCNHFMLKFFQKPIDEARDLYDAASPIRQVNAKTPPCLLLHGEEDEAVPVQQSEDFCNAIRAAGGHAEFVRVPLVGHAWFNHDPHFEPCLTKMMDFLVRRLG